MEVAMALKPLKLGGSVGRHTGSPRRQDAECQVDDQKTVIDLLNRIPAAAGGAAGALGSGQLRPKGNCSDALYHAIQTFENKQFPKGPHSGFVDPVRNPGKMLFKKMEELALAAPASTPATAQAAQQPAAKSPLDVLRRNVVGLHDSKEYWHAHGWSAGDHVNTDELVDMAHYIIDGLESEGKDKL